MTRAAIFLDRDGVINQNRPDHVKAWSEFRFVRGSLTALGELSQLAYPIIVVTNQAVVNRGMVTREEVDDIHRRMIERIEQANGRIDKILYCPHRPDEDCGCRKPRPGLFHRAAQQFGLDLSLSIFIGDAYSDIDAGQRVGCGTILVLTGRGRQTVELLRNQPDLTPSAIARDLRRAVPLVSDMLNAGSPLDQHRPTRSMPVPAEPPG